MHQFVTGFNFNKVSIITFSLLQNESPKHRISATNNLLKNKTKDLLKIVIASTFPLSSQVF